MNVKNIIKKFFERVFPRNEKELLVLIEVEKADSCGRLILVDGVLTEGILFYKDNFKLIDSYKAVKQVKINPEGLNVETIQQRLLAARKKAYLDSIVG